MYTSFTHVIIIDAYLQSITHYEQAADYYRGEESKR